MPPDPEFYRGVQSYHGSIRKTQAFEKFLNYIDGLLSKPEFLNELRWFRKHIANVDTKIIIPSEGLPAPKTHEELLPMFMTKRKRS